VLDRLGYDYFHNVVDVNLVYNDDSGKRLDNNVLTDEALAHLHGFPKLRKLALHGTQASDDGLKHVGNLRALEELFMWDASAVTDEGIAHLSGLKRLKYLHCTNTQITDESLRVLATLPSLTGISAQENRFTDQGLRYVQDMVRLKELFVGLVGPHKGPAQSGTLPRKPITDAGLVHLKGLVNLTLLDLQTTEVTSDGLKHLEGLKNLKDLWLSGSAVTDTSEFQKALPKCKITK
jgi:Leucine-rich repeat (LRR) protein